jgi:hypothetical protein
MFEMTKLVSKHLVNPSVRRRPFCDTMACSPSGRFSGSGLFARTTKTRKNDTMHYGEVCEGA